jgi:hypothetical protein
MRKALTDPVLRGIALLVVAVRGIHKRCRPIRASACCVLALLACAPRTSTAMEMELVADTLFLYGGLITDDDWVRYLRSTSISTPSNVRVHPRTEGGAARCRPSGATSG